MRGIKNNYLIIILGALLLGVFVFYNAYIMSLGESYLNEEVYVKNLVLDMMCDIAESNDARGAIISTVSEIDTLKQRGVYCAAYTKTADGKYEIISERSPLFGPYDPLDDYDLKRDVNRQNRGKCDVLRKADEYSPAHIIHIYWRWVYQTSDDPILILLGMSKFAVETNHESGLAVGFWVIMVAFVALGLFSIIPALMRKKREDDND